MRTAAPGHGPAAGGGRGPLRAAPAPWRRWALAAAVGALLAWSYRGTGVEVGSLLGGEALRQMASYLARLVPPDLSPRVLDQALRGGLETFAISLVGSLLAVLLAGPLALLAARTLHYQGVLFEGGRRSPAARLGRVLLSGGARGLLNALRTVPEVLWALLFVFMVGLGPFAGVLALGAHTAGVLGKLFAEVLEEVPPRPLEALRATGASRARVLLYGILPQAAPQGLSYALYRWEVNIRAAAILGLVGAGGLGQRIHVAISLFLEQELLTYIAAVYVLVTLVDALSATLRRRLT